MSDYDEQCERIKSVFALSEVPDVTKENLIKYLAYLKEKISCPCVLTGIESMGAFSWEERFEFGYGSEQEYERLRKKRGSYRDEYKLARLHDAKVEDEWDILVKVQRVTDNKRFVLPLSELEAVDESSDNYQLLNDYTVWYVNWR